MFFLEPFLNRDMENQAKNRVYRLGQTKDVVITKLLMRNTVRS